MSWLSKGLGKIKGVGKALKWAAPVLGALPIPGISTAVAAGIGGLGGLIEGGGDSAEGGGGWGGALKQGGMGAGMGALGSIGGKYLGGAIKGVGGMMGGGGGGGAPGAPGVDYGDIGGTMGGGGGGGGGFDLGGFLGGVSKYAPLALGAVGAFQNAKAATQNRELTEEQIQQARAAIERQKMLQDRALQPINVSAPDYSNLFRTQNPLAQQGG